MAYARGSLLTRSQQEQRSFMSSLEKERVAKQQLGFAAQEKDEAERLGGVWDTKHASAKTSLTDAFQALGASSKQFYGEGGEGEAHANLLTSYMETFGTTRSPKEYRQEQFETGGISPYSNYQNIFSGYGVNQESDFFKIIAKANPRYAMKAGDYSFFRGAQKRIERGDSAFARDMLYATASFVSPTNKVALALKPYQKEYGNYAHVDRHLRPYMAGGLQGGELGKRWFQQVGGRIHGMERVRKRESWGGWKEEDKDHGDFTERILQSTGVKSMANYLYGQGSIAGMGSFADVEEDITKMRDFQSGDVYGEFLSGYKGKKEIHDVAQTAFSGLTARGSQYNKMMSRRKSAREGYRTMSSGLKLASDQRKSAYKSFMGVGQMFGQGMATGYKPKKAGFGYGMVG